MNPLYCRNEKRNGLIFAVMIWLLAFQSPLEAVWGPFSYIDEFVALLGVLIGAYEIIIIQKCRFSKDLLWIGIPLCIFVTAGLAGNVIYQYQPWKSVIIDLYTNLKFFFAIAAGYFLCKTTEWDTLKKYSVPNAKTIVILLFCVFLADRILDIYPSEIRYGLKSAQLFYSHPTYLAGAMAFLVVLLTVFYEKQNLPFIAMALVMMAFTLRSKSIASAAAYAALFVFFVVFKRKLKLWHVVVLGAACVMIAWPQIRYYFVELGGMSTRSVMLLKSFTIMKDYFPIGTGFGTYASAEAAKNFSPVYELYNFEYLLRYELGDTWRGFLSDTFWPIIIGQTGLIGTAAFLTAMWQVVKRCLRLDNFDLYAYVGILFALIYLLISSIAEPAFHNAVAISLALAMGIIFEKSSKCDVIAKRRKDG